MNDNMTHISTPQPSLLIPATACTSASVQVVVKLRVWYKYLLKCSYQSQVQIEQVAEVPELVS
jgi:hypothetical protein